MPAPQVDDLRRAVKLFNRWQFEEAAAAFQQLAHNAGGVDQEFLAAWSQIALGFHRIWHKGGEANAMVNLVTRGREALRPFGDKHLGLLLTGVDEALGECLQEAMAWRRGAVEIFNRDLIPRLELESK